jgi:hypothetical protein
MKKSDFPALPPGFVKVDKKFGREVAVALVDPNRMVMQGFDVDTSLPPMQADVHFRIARHDRYAVVAVTKYPIEVRVLQDGKLLSESRLDPLPQPTVSRGDSQVRRQVAEAVSQPQPFFITHANKLGEQPVPLEFVPDPKGRSVEERVQMQIRPQAMVPVHMVPVQRTGDPKHTIEAKMDIDPVKLGLVPPPPAAKPAALDQTSSDAMVPGNVAGPADGITDGAAPATCECEHEHVHDDHCQHNHAPAGAPASAARSASEYDVNPAAYTSELPLPETWAESHGLVAIGIRIVQQAVDGEPPMAPDGFTYVLFQMNTFADNAKVRANLHFHIKLPPKVPYREYDDGAKHDELPRIVDHCCGNNHGHNPRRFR